jgi:hypothetical protein
MGKPTRKPSRNVQIGRRSFLMGAGASLVAGSFLQMFEKQALAQEGAQNVAKRCIIFFTPNGTVHKHWRPQGAGTSFSFPEGSILEPLADHKEDLLILDGIDFHGVANHEAGMANMLTGGHSGSMTGGMSLDQYLASQLGVGDKFPSLTLGVQSDSGWGASSQTRMTYTGPSSYKAPIDSPAELYNSMFGDLNADQNVVDAVLNLRKSVLDLVGNELKLLQNKVGTQERLKLEQHLSALEVVESGLQAPAGTCDVPDPVFTLNPLLNENFAAVSHAQIDLMVLALACGMTKVASLQCAHTVGPHVFSWLGLSEGHHSLSHIDDSNQEGLMNFVKAERWYAGEFAYLLSKLKELPEPDGEGTMLDNTVVLWAQELGDGRLHDCVSVPFVLAGGAGGYFNTGRYLSLGGAPHQKLLVSVCHAMGLNNPTFGNPAFGTGPLEELV